MRSLAGLSARQRLLGGVALIALVVLAIAVILLITGGGTSAASEQPIAFNHQIHAQNGIQCQFCHSGVDSSSSAGIPSVEFCMGCHTYVNTESPEIQKLTTYWENGEPIPWERIHDQPDYVHFSHQSHIGAGVSCGSCHGDVASMQVPELQADMTMGWCLNCHAEQENKDALWDCAVCHY